MKSRRLAVLAVVALLNIASAACGTDTMTSVQPPPPPPPPPPLTFDLRFKGVGTLSGASAYISSAVTGTLQQSYYPASGTPLQLGSGLCAPMPFDCAWGFITFLLPNDVAPIAIVYDGDRLADLSSVLDTAATDTVAQSLDLEPAESVFAVSRAVGGEGGYHLAQHVVSLAALQNAASQEGAQRRVITALSFESADVLYLSYGWDHDTTTAGYEARVMTVPLDSIVEAVDTLAAAGYVVTALGGDTTSGYAVVGTRIAGATTARGTLVNPDPTTTDLRGYAPVVYLDIGTGGRPYTLIFER